VCGGEPFDDDGAVVVVIVVVSESVCVSESKVLSVGRVSESVV
jgi:hypothetical protein